MYAAALLQGWRFSAFRDGAQPTSLQFYQTRLSSSSLPRCSLWTPSSCHCVDTASFKNIFIVTKLDHWDFTRPPWKDRVESLRNRSAFRNQSSGTSVCASQTHPAVLTLCTLSIISRRHICYSFGISGLLTVGEGPTTNLPWKYIQKKWCKSIGTSRVPQGQKFTRSSEDVAFFSPPFFQLPVLLLHSPVLEVNICFLSGKQSQCQDLVSRSVSTHRLPSPDSGRGNKYFINTCRNVSSVTLVVFFFVCFLFFRTNANTQSVEHFLYLSTLCVFTLACTPRAL